MSAGLLAWANTELNPAISPGNIQRSNCSSPSEVITLTRTRPLPTIAIGYMKRNLNVGLHGSLSDVLDTEAIHMIRTFETDDHKAAAAAFVEKRAPRFEGR